MTVVGKVRRIRKLDKDLLSLPRFSIFTLFSVKSTCVECWNIIDRTKDLRLNLYVDPNSYRFEKRWDIVVLG